MCPLTWRRNRCYRCNCVNLGLKWIDALELIGAPNPSRVTTHCIGCGGVVTIFALFTNSAGVDSLEKKISGKEYLHVITEGASWFECTMRAVSARLGVPTGTGLEVSLSNSLIILADKDQHTNFIGLAAGNDSNDPKSVFGNQVLDNSRETCQRVHILTLQDATHMQTFRHRKKLKSG